jgi:hypothetical protein
MHGHYVTNDKPQVVAWHPQIEGEHRTMLEGRLEVIQRMVRARRDEGVLLGETIFLVADPTSNVGQLLANVLGLDAAHENTQPLVVPLVGEQARAFVDAVCPPETMDVIKGRPEGTIAVAIVNRTDEMMVVYTGQPGDVHLMAFSRLPAGTA